MTIHTNLPLHEAGRLIAERMLGGLPFGGEEDSIYDEVPAVYIRHPVLGLQITLAGFQDKKVYSFAAHSASSVRGSDREASGGPPSLLGRADEYEVVSLSEYVASLLEGLPGIGVSIPKPSAESQRAFEELFPHQEG